MRKTPTALFVDTSYYFSQGLKFSTAEIERLKRHFRPKSLRLLLPDVAERELQRKFHERASAATQAIFSAKKEHPASLLPDWHAWATSESELQSRLVGVLEQEWAGFKDHFTVVALEGNSNFSRVLDWYFAGTPPFGPGKKAKEFPDALVVSSLDAYSEETSARIAVISRDGDFRKACETRTSFVYCESLAKFVEQDVAEQAVIAQIHAMLDACYDQIVVEVESEFANLEFSIEQDWNGEVDDLQCLEVILGDQSVVELSGAEFFVTLSGRIRYSAYLSYDDYDTATFDSSEGDVFVHHRNDHSVVESVRFSSTMRFRSDDERSRIEEMSVVDFSPRSVCIDANDVDDAW